MTGVEEFLPSEDEIDAARDAGNLARLIEDALGVIVDEPWTSIGRAADMAMLGFGKEIHAPTERDPERRIEEYALHVQCPLRVTVGAVSILGGADLYVKGDDPYETPWDFDFEMGGSLWDRRADDLSERLRESPPCVARVGADPWGGLTIDLTQDLRIDVFPWRSYLTEAWRFFRHGDTSRPLVVPADKH